jgi:hypothetical protein
MIRFVKFISTLRIRRVWMLSRNNTGMLDERGTQLDGRGSQPNEMINWR